MVDYWPWFVIRTGETGTLLDYIDESGEVIIRLDRKGFDASSSRVVCISDRVLKQAIEETR